MEPIRMLEMEQRRLSLEAHLISDTGERLVSLLKPMQRGISAFINFFNPTAPAIGLTTNVPAFLKLSAGAPYTDVRNFNAFVPEGLSVGYLEYIAALEPAVAHAVLVPDVLNNYATYLSLLVHRPDGMKETRSQLPIYTDLKKSREAALKAIDKCFKKGSTTTTVKLGTLVKNNKEWVDVLNRVQGINAQMSKVDRKQLDKKIAECLELVQALRKRAEADPGQDVSPETLTNLSEGTLQVAKELEFFSAIWFRVEGFTHAVDHTLAYFTELENKIRS